MHKSSHQNGGKRKEQETPPHHEIDSLRRGDVISSRRGEIEKICKSAFKDPNTVLKRIDDDVQKSSNPDRIFSRYYGLIATLFREPVFRNNDTAWKKLMILTEPGRVDYGQTPTGMGTAVFGLALRNQEDPNKALNELAATAKISPSTS